ncbi:hypothetical protein B7R22_12860 [Subtercola boreus]|uniref:CopG family transcriptional regulator n=1 Tax=Subtercola boreus TaxID=120213 RepID=A0A3E0VWF3_9MICO|nr:hypothetical protein [Subtercola boreus]RFA13688.1 hypothetical protein B7R22_12860 [Subtercola boreus]
MKTAISVPDPLFRQVEARTAQLKISRSEFYSTAATHYLRELERTSITEAINDALRRSHDAGREESNELTAYNRRKMAERLADDEW